MRDVNDVAPTFTSRASASVAENRLATGLVAAVSDPDGAAPVFAIAGGADAARFTIDAATGALSFVAAPDFEAPGDADGNNVYQVTLSARDGVSTTTQAVTITVTNVNDVAPTFTSAAAISVAENRVATGLVATVTDPDGGTPRFSIAGGADAAKFAIDAATGALSFVAAPDFERPGDVGGDNVYDVTLAASDGANRTEQAVRVTVTDVVEAPPSTLSAALFADTGTSATDGLTRDARISGALNPADAASLRLSIDGGAAIDVSAAVGADGRFTLDPTTLGSFAQGNHTLVLTTGAQRAQVAMTYDNVAPTGGSVALARSSDSGTVGDGITAQASVTLVGIDVEAGTTASIGGKGATLVSSSGKFALENVPLSIGDNRIDVTLTDAAGNATVVTLDVERIAGSATSDQVLFWNNVALEVIAGSATPPAMASRALAMQSVAVYDAISAIDGSIPLWVNLDAGADASIEAAVAYASYTMLLAIFPGRKDVLDARLAQVMDQLGTGEALAEGRELGTTMADIVYALRESDGYDAFVTHDNGSAPGEWVRTGPMYAEPELPQWATLDPFVIASPDQFRAGPPPALNSAEYAAAYNELVAIGGVGSTVRTADQTAAAAFWRDGIGTATPPGHWNDIAEVAAQMTGAGIAANARMYAMLNLALADASIAAWDTKYTYSFWRPETAIRNGDKDGNDLTAADPNWTPQQLSPAHPDYVSGHSTYSAAGAEILTYLFGEDFAFTVGSPTVAGVTRSFGSFDAAADEAGRSRIYGGIHFEFSNQAGQEIGRDVGEAVIEALSRTADTSGPRIAVTTPGGKAVKDGFDVSGFVIDNLSGVASLEASVDGGAFGLVHFDNLGRFTLDADALGEGAHRIVLRASDAAGNRGNAVSYDYLVDSVAPTIDFTGFADGASIAAGARIAGLANGTGSGLTALSYSVDGGAEIPVGFGSDGGFSSALDIAALAAGGHKVVVTARDAAGNSASKTIDFSIAAPAPFTVTAMTPRAGSGEVGLTQRPQVTFSKAVDASTLTADSFYATDAAGNRLAASIVTAADGKSAYLFLDKAMPGAQRITVHLDGARVKAADGAMLDGDANGSAGGAYAAGFTTISDAVVPGTTITGFIVGPGRDLKPMTPDDFRAGPDGVPHTADDVFLERLAGVKVYILGRESEAVLTAADGSFTLTNVPAGTVKVAIDGRTATNAPDGVFFPEMVMDVKVRAGVANTMMGTMGSTELQADNLTRGEVYLPRISKDVLVEISDTQTTTVVAKGDDYTGLTAAERDRLTLEVKPGSVLGEDGQPVDNAQVGISTVPPELVRDMLPDGLLQHTFDITIQAPGAAVFSEPLTMVFPNTFNAAPGTKLNFLSFDHTTGRLVIEGTATVSADGLTVVTDPGMGITKPGWHGLTPPGSPTGLPDDPAPRRPEPPKPDPDNDPPKPECEGNGIDVTEFLNIAKEVAFTFKNVLQELVKFGDLAKCITDIADKAANLTQTSLSLAGSLFEKSPQAWTDAFMVIDALKQAVKLGVEKVFNEASEQNINKIKAAVEGGIGALNVAAKTLEALKSTSDDPECATPGIDKALYAIKSTLLLTTEIKGFIALAENLLAGGKVAAVKAAFEAACILIEEVKYFIDTKDLFKSVFGRSGDLVSDDDVLALARQFAAGDTSVGDLLSPEDLAELQSLLARLNDANPLFEKEMVLPAGWPADFGVVDEAVAWVDYGLADVSHGISTFVELPGGAYYVIEGGASPIRGQLGADGSLDVFLPAETALTLKILDLANGLIGEASFTTGRSGENTRIPLPNLYGYDKLPDSDGDGLVDEAEAIIGTSATSADTDGDGLSDLFEIQNDLNPLGNFPTAQGVVASLDTGDAAVVEVVTVAGLGASASRLAFVQTGDALSIIDIAVPLAPVLLAKLATAGNATDVAVDVAGGIAAVATDEGVLIVDISDSADPAILRTLDADGLQVEFVDGLLAASDGARLMLLDPLTGELLAERVQSADVRAFAVEGDRLFVLSGNTLTAFTVTGDGALIAHDNIVINTIATNAQLFVGSGTLYVPAYNGFNGGYSTIDVRDLDDLKLSSGVDNAAIGGSDIALNGSGLGVAVGAVGGVGNTNAIDVVDVSDPAVTGDFVTRYTLGAAPTAVAIGSGFAFVGDASGGFSVVNYSGFDTRGAAPTATLTVVPGDVDPATPGRQWIEGRDIELSANLADDVQVRQVEVLVNGVVQSVDAGFPFDLGVRVPTIAGNGGSDTLTVQLRVTDMGGNIGLSELVTVELIPDTIAPALVRSNLSDGQVIGQSFRSFTFLFDEALDPASISIDSFRIVPDDGGAAVAPIAFQLRDGNRAVRVTFDTIEAGDYRLDIADGAFRDRAGNAAAPDLGERDFTVANFSIQWVGAATGGQWSDPVNWNLGRLPTAEDDVGISLADGGSIIVDDNAVAASVTSTATLQIQGALDVVLMRADVIELTGTLTVADSLNVGTFDMSYYGRFNGAGDVTIREGGTIEYGELTGTGTITVAEGAEVLLGRGWNPDEPNNASYLYLAQPLAVEGELTLGGGYVYFGRYDYTGSPPVLLPGVIAVADGGVFRLDGPLSDLYNYNGLNAGQITVADGGRFEKTGPGTAQISITTDTLPVIEGGRVEISGNGVYHVADGTVIDVLRVAGGYVYLDGDVSIGRLEMIGGMMLGEGDLTVTGTLDWHGGVIAGAGELTIAADATAMLGRTPDLDEIYGRESMTLGRDMTVEGRVESGHANLYLNASFYDPEDSDYISATGNIDIADGGAFIVTGDSNIVEYSRDGVEDIVGDGRFEIADGARLTAGYEGGTDAIDASDGEVIVTGVFHLTSGHELQRIVLSGGLLVVDDDVVLPELRIEGGTLTGAGDLTVTGRFDWRNGDLIGAGKLVLGDAAEARIGGIVDGQGSVYSGTLARTIETTGDLTIGDIYLYTYNSVYDPATRAYVTATGAIAASGDARIELTERVDFYGQRDPIALSGGATLVKTGLDTLQIATPFDDAITVMSGAGGIRVLSGGDWRVRDSAIETLSIEGGRVVADGDVQIGSLTMNYGTLTGTGDVTVTGGLNWVGGVMQGSGATVIADGATAVIGAEWNGSNYLSQYGVYLYRDLNVAGDATIEQARLYLSGTIDEGAGSVGSIGRLIVDSSGELTFAGAYSDVSRASSLAAGIVNNGSIVKMGGGTSTVDVGIAISGSGSYRADAGLLDLPDRDIGSLPVIDPVVAVGESVDAGEVLELAAGTDLSALTVNGGIVRINGDVTIGHLVVISGTLEGAGALTIEDQFDWLGGTLAGTGATVIADGATAAIGRPVDAESLPGQSAFYLGRDLDIAGDVTVSRAVVYAGAGTANSAFRAATIDVLAGGSLVVDGGQASLYRQSSEGAINVDADGSFVRRGPGSSQINLAVNGDVTVESGTLDLSGGGTLTGVAGAGTLKLTGGEMKVPTDLSIANLALSNSILLSGDGAIEVTDRFDWDGGVIRNGGLTVGADAFAQFGRDVSPGSFAYPNSTTLGTTLTIEGEAAWEALTVYLGTAYWDGNEYRPLGGEIVVGAGGGLTFVDGQNTLYKNSSEKVVRFTAETGADVEHVGSGKVMVGVEMVGVDALFDSISLRGGGSYHLTADSPVTSLSVEGGILWVDEDAVLDTLVLGSGAMVAGPGKLTITGEVSVTSYAYVVNTGGLAIGDGATMQVGVANGNGGYLYLGNELSIEGSVQIDRGAIYQGYQTDLGSERYGGASSVRVADGGSLRLSGPDSGLFDIYYGYNRIVVEDGGSFTRDGAGASQIGGLIYGDIKLEGGGLILRGGVWTIDDGAHYDHITVESGILIVQGNVSIGTLTQTGGQVRGSGTLTVTKSFEWTGGIQGDDGVTIVADGAIAQLGRAFDGDTHGYYGAPLLGRELRIEGSASVANGYVTLDINDYNMGAWLGSGLGTVHVAANGTLLLEGAYSDFRSAGAIVNDGTIIKRGGGTSTIAGEIDFVNNGTIVIEDGRLLDGDVAIGGAPLMGALGLVADNLTAMIFAPDELVAAAAPMRFVPDAAFVPVRGDEMAGAMVQMALMPIV